MEITILIEDRHHRHPLKHFRNVPCLITNIELDEKEIKRLLQKSKTGISPESIEKLMKNRTKMFSLYQDTQEKKEELRKRGEELQEEGEELRVTIISQLKGNFFHIEITPPDEAPFRTIVYRSEIYPKKQGKKEGKWFW